MCGVLMLPCVWGALHEDVWLEGSSGGLRMGEGSRDPIRGHGGHHRNTAVPVDEKLKEEHSCLRILKHHSGCYD